MLDGARDSTEIAVSRAARRVSRVTFPAGSRLFLIQLVFIALACWLAFNWFETIRRIIYCYTPLPNWDYWNIVEHYAQYITLNPHFLWQQHNEHRIVFPEIVFALDMLFMHGRQILPLLVSFFCYFSIFVVLAWTLFSDCNISRLSRAVAVLLAGVVIGWEGSASGLALPFLLQWPLTQLAAIISLGLITLAKENRLCLVLTIAAAVIATYSSGNGMMLWPILIAAALLLRLPRPQTIAVVISAVVFIGLYFVGYHFLNDFQVANFYRHPFYSVGFIAAYFGMPFGAMKSQTFGVYVGLVSLIGTACLLVCAVRARLLSTRPGIVLFGFCCFTLLTAVITAAGRMEPSDPTFTAAKAERYITVPLVNWAIFICLALWVAGRRRWKVLSPSVMAACFALLLAIGFFKLRWSIHVSDQGFADIQESALSVEDGLRDPKLMRRIFPDPPFIIPLLAELKSNRLSIYYDSREAWLGQPVSRFAKLAGGAVSGAVTGTHPVEGGIQVFGWAEAPRYRWIVLANEANQIAGFGERLPAGTPDDLKNLETPHPLSWVGFVNLKVKGSAYRAFVVDRRGLVSIEGSF